MTALFCARPPNPSCACPNRHKRSILVRPATCMSALLPGLPLSTRSADGRMATGYPGHEPCRVTGHTAAATHPPRLAPDKPRHAGCAGPAADRHLERGLHAARGARSIGKEGGPWRTYGYGTREVRQGRRSSVDGVNRNPVSRPQGTSGRPFLGAKPYGCYSCRARFLGMSITTDPSRTYPSRTCPSRQHSNLARDVPSRLPVLVRVALSHTLSTSQPPPRLVNTRVTGAALPSAL